MNGARNGAKHIEKYMVGCLHMSIPALPLTSISILGKLLNLLVE